MKSFSMIVMAGALVLGSPLAMAESPDIPGVWKVVPPMKDAETAPARPRANVRSTTGSSSSDASGSEVAPQMLPAAPQEGKLGDAVGTTGPSWENQESR